MLIPGKVLHEETQRHVSLMSVRDNAHIEDLDILIRALVDGGLWPLLDTLCVAGPDSDDSLLDLKGLQNSTLVGTPVFVADQGFTTVSTTSIIDTQFTMPVSHDKSNALSVYLRSAPPPTPAGTFIGEQYDAGGGVTGATDLGSVSTTVVSARVQSVGATGYVSTTGKGFRLGARKDASTFFLLVDGVVTTVPIGATTWNEGAHLDILVGAVNTATGPLAPAPNQYAHWSVGAGMDAGQGQAYHTIIKDYFTRRGTAV